MPEPAPASHPSPSGLKRFHGDSREVHMRSMYEYDIITRLLCPFFSMLLRWMYRILLLCCVLSVFLWLFQLGFDIIHLLVVVSTRPWEQPENPQVVMVMVTALLVIRCLLPSIFCQKQRRLVFLYPLSSVVPVLVMLLVFWVFPWLLQLFTRLWGGQPENPQLEVEILAAFVVVLQWLQFIFCRERFRRNRLLVQWGAWAAYYAPLPLAAFAVGVMLKFRCPYWLVAIFFAAGQADSMAAYRLDDDSQKVRRFAKRTLMLAYLILALLQLQEEGGSVPCRRRRPIAEMYSLALGLFVFLVHLKITIMEMIPSIDICMVARRAAGDAVGSLESRAVVAVGSLESHGTAVSGCTTYKDILHLNYSSELKDACLSSASFLQLLQRYSASQSQAEVVDSSSSVNNILRACKSTKDGCARAFKIVEVELSFLYDYFFSTHGSPSHTSYRVYNDYSISKIGFLFSILSLVYPADDEEEAAKAKPELGASVYAVYALILLELCQLVVYLTSNWLVVSVMCDRAKNSRHTSALLRILGTLFRIAGSKQRRWPNELGQYVLIENCHRTSLKERLLGSLLGLRQRGSLGSPVALSDEMKRWVLKAAADHSGFTFPIDDELSWAWRQDTEARTILIWHIATWFCAKTEEKMVFPTSACGLLSLPEYRVAVTLSSYCAYLVTFRPELLPGHQTIAASVFDEAITEAEFYLEDQTSPSERYKRMATWLPEIDPFYQPAPPDQGILMLGVRLGRQLIDMEGSSSSSSYKYWKTIANFWIEMLLHVAQADNVTAHIEHLAKGGEFVTHLWALLSHAGIKRNRPFDFKQGPVRWKEFEEIWKNVRESEQCFQPETVNPAEKLTSRTAPPDDGAKSGQAYESKGKGRAN